MLDKLNYLAVRNFPFALVLEKGHRKLAIEKLVGCLEYFWLEELRYLNESQADEIVFDQERNVWDMGIRGNLIRQKSSDATFFDQSLRLSLLFSTFRENYSYIDLLEIYGFSGLDFQTHYLAAWDELADIHKVKIWQSLEEERSPNYCHRSRGQINSYFLQMVSAYPTELLSRHDECPYCQAQLQKLAPKVEYLKSKLPGRLEVFSEREKTHLNLILKKTLQISPPLNRPTDFLSKIGQLKNQFFSNL